MCINDFYRNDYLRTYQNYSPLELSGRVIFLLQKGGINSVSDLKNCYAADLMRIKGFGKKALNEVERELSSIGLTLITDGRSEANRKRASENKKHRLENKKQTLMLKLRPASEIYGVSYDRLRKWCLAGTIASVRTGRDILINTRALEDYLNTSTLKEVTNEQT